ncbi:MAG: thioredoxin [Aurantimonas coralicida]|jgi:thioredoxin 1|uniref:Thioredoxin n=1 Tax=Aurantimonas manganoxydans (strain ATCC BAA-1229 / DSM 21871 / SI85-9A1) TaxID=287752 RepID=Q1YFA5_AURMS|nr:MULTISPECIES: thioredoxin [Aurantimonas]MAY28533.1 thioredoxin [Aurantimonas sp.]EAS49068.1 thioredoxin [Aurantimonas manganoxydans SI85-9A1]MBC6715319.1 thioredoxin [Aurantimonas sp. DM33-3]MCC4296729.1 thioredoxin [Aurantimonas coralicida]MCD1645021.1 thioredoxin [Aurantimonas coralicida]|tara:strand:+ start:61 stop:381 length:321 start_codon:yes stop_codon:yes gene_type:complete|eukprot:TRINITY_DN48097_c0_g1_i1.p3 TRINITY_DN48097_c0_g1~~TRINITY_DN48097_c0_g1_i1.p3  ORF type:complete len:107 (-),score=34.75 TRINITY_DN48097_c0_g1_i1:18-338(-)
MATTKIDTSNFQTDVLGSDKPVVVDFWAEWCGPCKMIAPSLEEISNEMDNVRIAKVNIDENPDIAAQFGVRSIPTLMIFKNGEHADTMVGAQSKSKLVDWINKGAA